MPDSNLAPEPPHVLPIPEDYYHITPTHPFGGVLRIQIDEVQTTLIESGKFTLTLTLTPKGE